ncbi:MAG: hypothetical protein HGB26_01635 [Desulfobulbaceae bacterium]|nr:hypothetical protein [Desulfobulbaceae bacterium]
MASIKGRYDGRLLKLMEAIYYKMNKKNAAATPLQGVRDLEKDKTPHSARHGMGVFIMEKTGNVVAVQRQLGHKNASFSLQYSRITNDELKRILDER